MPKLRHLPPIPIDPRLESEVADAARARGLVVHLDSNLRRSGGRWLRFFDRRDRASPVADFASHSAALRWLATYEAEVDS